MISLFSHRNYRIKQVLRERKRWPWLVTDPWGQISYHRGRLMYDLKQTMATASNMLSLVSSYCIQDTLRFANKPIHLTRVSKPIKSNDRKKHWHKQTNKQTKIDWYTTRILWATNTVSNDSHYWSREQNNKQRNNAPRHKRQWSSRLSGSSENRAYKRCRPTEGN